MHEVSTLVTAIEEKLSKLLESRRQLIEENQQQKKTIEKLTSEIEQYKDQIKQLEENNKLLKLAKTLETKEGNVEAKLKINELVREIDKCIRLLNT